MRKKSSLKAAEEEDQPNGNVIKRKKSLMKMMTSKEVCRTSLRLPRAK